MSQDNSFVNKTKLNLPWSCEEMKADKYMFMIQGLTDHYKAYVFIYLFSFF